MIPDLKVYVWPNFYLSSEGTTGFAIALARNFESAIALVEEDSGVKYNDALWGDVSVLGLKEMAFGLTNSD